MKPSARHGNTRVRGAMHRAALVAIVLAGPAHALDITLPEGAMLVASRPPAAGTHSIATGTWDGTAVPLIDVSGTLNAAVWQIPATDGVSIGSVTSAIEQQLLEQGYQINLNCAESTCGGFDFRRRLDMGQSPEMHVDIGNFHYLAAHIDTPSDAVALTISSAGQTIYLHVVHVGDAAATDTWVTPPSRALSTDTVPPPQTGVLSSAEAIARLEEHGATRLDDLRFRTGASELSGNEYPTLVALAAYLSENPDRRVVLVGHTDAEGGLDSNIALSEARAGAVRRHLIDRLDVNPAQLDAAGIGYLAPRATNDTAEGREANRRVEVVLLNGG